MELWILVTFAAALFQTVRFMLQKVLSVGTLSTGGATFARFFYAAPFGVLLTGAYLAATGAEWPALGPVFWAYGLSGALGQILATLCVVALFRQRNFAVGITFKKTEVIQTALVGLAVLGEAVTNGALVAILIGLAGVVLLSDPPGGNGVWHRRVLNRAAGLGLLSGFFFAISAVGYRGASLEIASDDPLLRAAVTYVAVVLSQLVGMGLWLRLFDPGQISRVWRARKVAVWIGVTSMAGSLSWFLAFTLQTAAYVQAVGQVELIFSILASVLFFREKVTGRELAGIALLVVSILALIAVT